MKRILCLLLVCLGWDRAVPAQDNAAAPVATVFQIGTADHDYREFALAGNHGAYLELFPRDVTFVGRQKPAQTGLALYPARAG